MRRSSLVLVLVLMVALSVNAFAEKLVIWESPGPETNFLKEVTPEFTAETGIEVEVVGIDQLDQADKLALDGPAGKGADIVVWPHDRVGRSVLQGLLSPLSISEGELEPYVDSAVDAMRYDGNIYGLPYAMETTALIYNKDLLPTVPNTMDTLFTLAKSMTDAENNEYGFLYDVGNFYFSYGFISGHGGHVFKQTDNGLDVDQIGLANEGAVKGAKLLKRFRTEGIIPEGTDYSVMDGLFREGKVAAIINGPWAFAEYKDAGINYGIAPLPKLSNGSYPQTFMGVKGYYLSEYSENKENALKLMKWLTSKKMAYKHYEMNAIIPANEEVMAMPEFKEDKDLLAFATQAGRGVPMPNVPEMMQVWDPMANAITYILNGEATPEIALELAVEEIKEGIWEMKH